MWRWTYAFLDSHLVAQAQRPLNGEASVAEVGVVEALRRATVAELAIKLHDLGGLVVPLIPPILRRFSLRLVTIQKLSEVLKLTHAR